MSVDHLSDVVNEMRLEAEAWAQTNLTTSKVSIGKALTFPFMGQDKALQLVLRELVMSPTGDKSFTFSVHIYGVSTGKEVYCSRTNGRWSFTNTMPLRKATTA